MHTLRYIFVNSFKLTWQLLCFLREIILNFFLLLLVLLGISLFLFFKNLNMPIELKSGALLINLNGIIVDQPLINNKVRHWWHELFGISSARLQQNSLFELVNKIRQAKNDKTITGIVLQLNDLIHADQPTLNYIGKALREFRDYGKPIFAIGNNYTQTQYYLASYATKIYLSPYGRVDLHGFASNKLYYKSLLNKLNITPHIFRIGSYKSAIEPLIRDDMSMDVRKANTRWINGLWNNYLKTVSSNRHITPEEVFPQVEKFLYKLKKCGGNTSKYALDAQLIDQIESRTVIEKELSKIFGWNKHTNNFNAISIYDYPLKVDDNQKNEIAVVCVNGIIMDKQKYPGIVNNQTIIENLRKSRLDPKIKAVILRVNSPGGSVYASEEIRSELEEIHASGKPIVVSMGGIAASGGYWISTPANYIIASPSTLTGSIGIFSVINTYERTLNSLGVHADGVATSPLADVTVTKNLSPEFSKSMQISIDHGYKTFMNLVSQSRKIKLEELEKIAQGRVWLGIDAKNNGLVDLLGDFDDAIKIAAKLANLKQWQLNWFINTPNITKLFFSHFSDLVQNILLETIKIMLPPPILSLTEMTNEQTDIFNILNDPQNRYALCIHCINI
ncbi:Protease 4 [Candidatus Ecksteinia adelgidicola]|nr:Protease 4 [Candidatus Ecksteinia adelgidicola]